VCSSDLSKPLDTQQRFIQTAMPRFSILLSLAAATALSTQETDVEVALHGDDQCAAGDTDCALNALQARSLRSTEVESAGADDEADEDLDSEWLKDISVKTKNYFKHKLIPLQKPIVFEYQQLKVLERYANYTMMVLENATGSQVIWNAKAKAGALLEETSVDLESLLQEDEEDEEERDEEDVEDEVESSMGRRRHSGHGKSLPPRARYIDKIIIYLEKEMQRVWLEHTMVDRKRWGCGNTITSMPYGPHGEHPDRWSPNVTVARPLFPPPLSVTNHSDFKALKVKEHKFENKYAQRLQADYANLISNINDAEKKVGILRKALVKMNGHANEFAAAPSGVFNRIETQ